MSAWTQDQVRQALRERRSSLAVGQSDAEERQQCRTAWTALCALADSYYAGDIGLVIYPGNLPLQASWQSMEAIRIAIDTLTSHPDRLYRRLAESVDDNEVRFLVFLSRRSGVVRVHLREIDMSIGAVSVQRGCA